ncbi:MAG: hypothetical protein V7K71_30145 [Nostoc sp.]
MTVAPIRFAIKRSSSGEIMRSLADTRYHDRLDFQAAWLLGSLSR